MCHLESISYQILIYRTRKYQNTEISEYGNISGHLTKTVQLSLIGNHSKQTFYFYYYDQKIETIKLKKNVI